VSSLDAPLPPSVMMRRVGHGYAATDEQVVDEYVGVGAQIHETVLSYLPEGWSPAGRRILDFGAGAGRALRHFEPELDGGAELWGCDIDGPSVEWARGHLPECTFFHNSEAPPLDVPDEHFDVVFAMSVFTHITSHWADWLIELHRVLRPDGLLIASFLGASMHELLLGEPYDDRRVGMLISKPGAPWTEEGGPLVFHSPWWLEAHWSPTFELLRIDDSVLEGDTGAGHGIVLGRRRAGRPARADLLAPAPGEPREATAALRNVERLCAEVEALRAGVVPAGGQISSAEVPERYDPALHRDEPFEAAHMTRYRWASDLVSGRRVLDAGCGVGYGTRLLAEAGASEAVGVDLSDDALDRARSGGGAGTRFVVGDLLDLPFEDEAFDVVVSFEAIEHVAEPEQVLAELARVLRPDGLLIVSTPNSAVSGQNNPHHLRELTPDELETALKGIFGHVRLAEQREWFASVVTEVGAGTGPRGTDASLRRPPVSEGEEFVIALASNAGLPERTRPAVTLWRPDGPPEAIAAGPVNQAFANALSRERALHEEAGRLQESLRESAVAYEAALDGARQEAAAAQSELASRHDELERTRASIVALQQSASWRVTSPLRRLKRLARPS